MKPTIIAVLLLGSSLARAQDRPNILWLTTEDISPHIGSFGDTYAVTPTIDRLAAEGVRYLNAFAAIGVCAPSRSSLIMGTYAPSVGTQHMRSKIKLPASVKLYSQLLREAGYYTTNNSKEDYNLSNRPKDAWDDSSNKAHWRNRKDKKQPFFAVFNFVSTHESQIRLSDGELKARTAGFTAHERHDPALAPIPPYHPDTPEVRLDWARYADNITFMDKQVAGKLQELAADGLTDDTIIFFYSDHGAGMPRSKRWLYDSSLHVPFIVKFGKRWTKLAPAAPGSTTDRLINLTDAGPTALSLAGASIPAYMQGRAFLGAKAAPASEYVYGFRDRMDERYDMLRTARDKRYRYIRNYMPHRIWAQHVSYMYEMPTMQVWQKLFDGGKLVGAQKIFFQQKPAEELYDTWADPHEVTNLAASADHRAVLDRMRGALNRWQLEIHDTGFMPEGEMHARVGDGTPYDLARDPARYDLPRILETADLATRRDPKQVGKLATLLGDKDSVVRYWGATGLAALGDKARPATAALRKALTDSAPDVRIAAAEALCNLDQTAAALPVLAAAMKDRSEPVRLHAVNVLSLLGDRVRPLLPELKAAVKAEPDETYPGRVLPWLVKKLGG